MNKTHCDFTPLNPYPFEDPKVRFRHHSLMQDYQELHMVLPTLFFLIKFQFLGLGLAVFGSENVTLVAQDLLLLFFSP